MQKLKTKLDMACIKAKNWIAAKKEGSEQLMLNDGVKMVHRSTYGCK